MGHKCETCGSEFRMGFDGTVDGCDSCTGVQRDFMGYAWLPDETEQERYHMGLKRPYTVRWEDAMKNPYPGMAEYLDELFGLPGNFSVRHDDRNPGNPPVMFIIQTENENVCTSDIWEAAQKWLNQEVSWE